MSDGYKVVLKEDSGIQMTPEIQDWLDMVNKELNKPESVATAEGKPVTRMHPRCDRKELRRYSKGTMINAGTITLDGFKVPRVKMVIFDDSLASEIDTKKLKDFSPGYHGDIDWTEGTHPQFGQYDGIQIRHGYNHGAVCQNSRTGKVHLYEDGDEMDDEKILAELQELKGLVSGFITNMTTFMDTPDTSEEAINTEVEKRLKDRNNLFVGLYLNANSLGVPVSFDDSVDLIATKVADKVGCESKKPIDVLNYSKGYIAAARPNTGSNNSRESKPLVLDDADRNDTATGKIVIRRAKR